MLKRGKGRAAAIRGAAVLAAVGVLLNLGSACSFISNAESDARAVELKTYTSKYGIRLAIEFAFPEDRVLREPFVVVDDDREEGGVLWPLDGTDHEGEDLDPLTLPADTSVLFESTVRPDCNEAKDAPSIRFGFESELPGGEKKTETFVPSNLEAYLPAIRLWCDSGVALQAGGGSYDEGGEARVAMLINNPTTDEIHVQMPGLKSDGATWQPLDVRVPPGAQTTEIMLGTGVRCETEQDVPWASGRILINGRPLEIPVADTWC